MRCSGIFRYCLFYGIFLYFSDAVLYIGYFIIFFRPHEITAIGYGAYIYCILCWILFNGAASPPFLCSAAERPRKRILYCAGSGKRKTDRKRDCFYHYFCRYDFFIDYTFDNSDFNFTADMACYAHRLS